MSHDLSGNCQKCDSILDLYPGFHEELRTWFKALQLDNPELHCSAAGRGKIEQEILFMRGASRAHYGESAHSYNAAVDVFFLIDGQYNLLNSNFERVIEPNIYSNITWYGNPKAQFYERPHCEISSWKQMVKDGTLKLVE